ncbi:hypothetical protein BH23ACT4_BH23ACT4_16370 [soil metagenome]
MDCGKTGLITLLPFGIADGRVLVIAPTLRIRNQLSDDLKGGPQHPPRRLSGWIGAVTDYLALDVTILTSDDPDMLRAAYTGRM